MGQILARLKVDYPGFRLDVDLDLPAHGVSALFGPSGCGKTTCLRAVAGLERAPGGYLQIDGDVWQDDAQNRFLPTYQRPVGYVFQEASLFPHLSVRGNVEYGMKRVPRSQRRVSLTQAVDLLGIGHLMDRKPDTLSGGERQRVAMARALATSPRLLLLDEPLAALDTQRKSEVLPYLERLHRELRTPVLYVTHAIDEVMRLADTLVVLDRGRVVAAGPVADMLSRPDVQAVPGEDAGSVFEGTVQERDERWHLARVVFPGGALWLPMPELANDMAIGRAVRVRVLARDVSIARESAAATSIQNLLPCVVDSIAPGGHPSQALVRLMLGAESALLARVTHRAVDALGLAPGQAVWAQVKAAALVG